MMMAVDLRPMTPEEFVAYEQADAHRYAQAMVSAGYWSSDDALKRAKDTHAKLLPDGIHTKDHLFFVIHSSTDRIPVGAIWLFIDRQTKPPSGFIYDLLIHEPYRRRGFGREAMLALEEKAKGLGLGSLALHVFEENAPAKALYASLGYLVKSMNMTKALLGSERSD